MCINTIRNVNVSIKQIRKVMLILHLTCEVNIHVHVNAFWCPETFITFSFTFKMPKYKFTKTHQCHALAPDLNLMKI